jgi:anti-sigma factor RsiW
LRSPPPTVSDEDLHALVDGEADPGQREALLRFLETSPEEAARVEAWRRQNETIRAAFARVITEPIPFSLSLSARGADRSGACRLAARAAPAGSAEMAAAARHRPPLRHRPVLLTLLAFTSGFGLAAAVILGPGLIEQTVVQSQIGALPKTRDSLVEPARAALDALSALRLDRVPGTAAVTQAAAEAALVVPNLSRFGMRLAGVKVFPNGASDASLCLIYSLETGPKAALCIERTDDGSNSEPRMAANASGPGSISWRQKGARYALAGPLSETELRRIADAARADVEAFGSR